MYHIIWKKSKYNLFISKWGIAIILKAGYKILYDNEDKSRYIKICENMYFSLSLLPYPNSILLTREELEYFCKGLTLVNKQIMEAVQNQPCLIILRSILFSDCNIQYEAFTVSAIQWASEIFGFSMPTINVWFHSAEKPCGKYIFDFSNISF